jgi:NFU1 iron-sulfur cluster scaffold homolog, mitochondrial
MTRLSDPGNSLAPRLRQFLAQRPSDAPCLTYAQVIAALEIAPPAMARLTQTLEDLMTLDTAQGRPLIAARVVSRGPNALPARGFFDHAAALGHDVSDAAAFHRAHLADLGKTPPLP